MRERIQIASRSFYLFSRFSEFTDQNVTITASRLSLYQNGTSIKI